MNTAADISDNERQLTIAIQVLNVTEASASSSVSRWLKVRDVNNEQIDFVIFENNPSAKWTWDEGSWYRLENVIGHKHQGDKQLKPPYDDAIDISPLEDRPDTPSDGGAGGQSTERPTGPTLFQTQLEDSLETVDAHVHKLRLDEGYEGDTQAFTAKVAARYRYGAEVPVTSLGPMRIVSTTRLHDLQKVDGHSIELEYDGETTLNATNKGRGNEVIEEFVKQDIKLALGDDPQYDVTGIDTIVEREPTLESNDGRFAAYKKYGVRVWVDSAGITHCGIHTGFRYTSTFTADEYIERGHDITGVRVEHDPSSYQVSGTGRVFDESNLRYTDSVPDMGGITIRKHHVQEDRVVAATADQVADTDPHLLYVDYSGGATSKDECGLQAPQFLRIVPTLDELKRLDPAFHDRATAQARMEPATRSQVAESFVADIGYLSALDTNVIPTFSTDRYDLVNVDEQASNLEFAEGHTNRVGNWGLGDTGVYKSVDDFDILALYPETCEDQAWQYGRDLTRTLTEIDAPPTTFDSETYELTNQLGYSAALQSAGNYDCVFAVVPDPQTASEADYDDPYPVFKTQLSNRHVPSQMVTIPQLTGGGDVDRLNVAAGLVAAAGGIPWRIADMPGSADAFIGLDVHADVETNQHVGASANLVLADGTVFNSKSITLQQGEGFEVEAIVDAVGDLLHAYLQSEGEQFDHLVILRDGQLYASVDELKEQFTQLKGDVSIVEVRKSGAPRVVEATSTGYTVASKGTGFVHRDDDHAILATTGAPELRDFGTPRPLRVQKRMGPVDMETLCRQLYWLSEAHVGSVSRSVRTPVPIYYADKCAEAAAKGYLVTGQTIEGLPYL